MMAVYKIESNSGRVVDILRRSIVSTSRCQGAECKVVEQGEKSITIESEMRWQTLDPIISAVRKKLFRGELFSLVWPDGVVSTHRVWTKADSAMLKNATKGLS